MSHIDVHEIKLNLRYPNSRQEDITDAFMRGYQGAVKIGNDAVRRVKAEKAALERRIDELCAEVEAERQRNDKMFEAAVKWMAKAAHFEAENAKLRADQAHWELGNCPGCPNIADLQEALEQNGKLREQTELLVTLLRNDCDIEASWDGLRKFWYIGLTESGCLMRDRACKAEAENAKLREQVEYMTPIALYAASEQERDRMRELGVTA